MLQTLYYEFGFLGSIAIAMLIFLCFIFWMAGIAGISQMPKSDRKNIKLTLSIIFPPYTIAWIFFDIYRQYRKMKETDL